MSVHVFIVSRRLAPVKGFCKDFCPTIKNLEFYRNTQENCIFNLQKGCVFGEQKRRVSKRGEIWNTRVQNLDKSLPAGGHHPRQIHQRQRRRNGGQEAENIVFFTQQVGESRGDDVAVGVIKEVEVRAQGFVQKVDGQGGAEEKGQHLRHPADAGAVAAHDEENRVEYQQGVDGDGVQIDEAPRPNWRQ